MKKIFISLMLIIGMLFTLLGCNNSDSNVEKPDFKTQKIKEDIFQCEIPSTWKKTNISQIDGQVVFTVKDADLSKSVSNISLIANKTDSNAPSMSEAQEQIKKQLESNFKDNLSDITFDEMDAPCGKVCVIKYKLKIYDNNMNLTLYYPLVDKYLVTITSTDVNDDISPSPDEVAKHIINTLKLK
ncbi:MAG: hypothetical protein SOY42_06710 [Clostridium sp.]|nr:hypothetical protein [Clostridium sp.]